MPDFMTLTAYAARRGVTKQSVSEAVRMGRLRSSVVRDARGHPKISDPELADQEWEENTDETRKPEPDDPDMAGAAAREKHWRAKLAELKFREAAAELVQARDVERRLAEVFHQCRTKLLGIPSRAKQALPELTVAQIGTLENLIRESLEALANG